MKHCVKKYSTNFSDTRGQIAIMPGVVNLDETVLSFYATAPFLILGLCEYATLPETGPDVYSNSRVIVSPADIQAANAEWLQALFIAMGLANAQPEGVSNGMTAYNSSYFSEYMYKYLNPDLIRAYFNTYIAPANQVIDFWKSQDVLNVPANDSAALRSFAEYIFNNSSLPLFNPPGLYEINIDANSEPYAVGLSAYLGASDNKISLVCQQMNAPTLAQNNPLGNPLLNTINSINFGDSIPDAILWT